jgi:hypothetical protein
VIFVVFGLHKKSAFLVKAELAEESDLCFLAVEEGLKLTSA